MKSKILFCLATAFAILQSLTAQGQLPVIRAASDQVDIREGKEFYPGQWTIVPDARPDVYTTSVVGENVTFYTDKDSISFRIEKDGVYDFVILLNGKDSAYTQIKHVPSYLDILQGASAYNYEDHTATPEFYYQDSSAAELRTLRKALNLDSIAGQGTEILKIINLMHWIHDLIPHDGNHDNPIVKNAMSMIRECKAGDRGLNCRGLATVLNECYLALGIKSRFVTCMPKDSVFNDCHVINMVYSTELNKWIWMDPTNDAYVMDENGVLLGLEEVRERLINGKTLILNPDANWNNRATTTREYYLLEYMAKNLYRLECPMRSEYDFETRLDGRKYEYVELLPLDGYRQTPKISERSYQNPAVSFMTYKTNNPDQFWVLPGEKSRKRTSGSKVGSK